MLTTSMSAVISSTPVAPFSHVKLLNAYTLRFHRNAFSNPCISVIYCRFCWGICPNNHTSFIDKPSGVLKSARGSINPTTSADEENILTFDWEDDEDVEDTGSPWEGAVKYKRDPSISHLEYCTTLERLGLEKLSTEVSKTRASAMGLRVTKAVKDYPNGTPVQISIDVTRKKQKLRLDGIVKTVITLGCNRCGKPAAESVFSDFSLLLSEEPIEEPDVIDIGAFFSENASSFSRSNQDEEEDDDASIDWDDRLYFPVEEKEIDISKHIRDMVHLEITINAICDPGCRGICLNCGTDLNTSSCSCSIEVKEKGHGPLRDLKKQMQKK